MALKDFVEVTRTVPVGAVSFEVRPLSAADVLNLTKDHFMALAKFYQRIVSMDTSGDKDAEEILGSSFEFLQNLPHLISDVIILAAEAKTEFEIRVVHRLPLSVQMDAIRHIFEITIQENGGVKKLHEAWSLLASQVAPILTGKQDDPQKPQTSTTG